MPFAVRGPLLLAVLTGLMLLAAARADAQVGGKVFSLTPKGVIIQTGPQNFVPCRIIHPNNDKGPVKPATVEITGFVGPEYLRPGLFVQFLGEFDNRKAKGEVTELTLFGSPPMNAPAPLVFAPGEGGDDAEGGQLGAASGLRARTITGKFSVFGKIDSFKAGNLIVDYAPRESLRVVLAENANIQISSADFLLIAPGDDIVAHGKEEGGTFIANRVEVKKLVVDQSARRAAILAARTGKSDARPQQGEFGEEAKAGIAAGDGVVRPKQKGKIVRVN
jgi:hypothetical protein